MQVLTNRRCARRFSWHSVALLSLFVWTASCGSAITHDDLIGTYDLVTQQWTETLELRADGRYRQEARVSGEASPNTHEGNWEFKDGSLTLRQAMVVDNGFGQPLPITERTSPGDVILIPKRTVLGNTVLPLDPDHDILYTKRHH
jgi:hypothetical protein